MSEFTYTVTIDEGALRQMGQEAGAFIRKVAFGIVTEMKLSFNTQKSGRLYQRGARGIHQASAPGEAPAVDYGNLQKSIQVTTGDLSAEIGIGAEYASYLETGWTRRSVKQGPRGRVSVRTSRIAPRPYVQPAIDAISEKYSGILSSARR